jgi:hypothetical protein
VSIDIPHWADTEAWNALHQANHTVWYLDPSSGKRTSMAEWKARHAPSVGARARAILNTLLYPPSYVTKCEEALELYVSVSQNADRKGFWSPRRSNAPQLFKGVRQWG